MWFRMLKVSNYTYCNYLTLIYIYIKIEQSSREEDRTENKYSSEETVIVDEQSD